MKKKKRREVEASKSKDFDSHQKFSISETLRNRRCLKQMNKKAMFFTLLAIALLSLFLVSYTTYSVVRTREAIQKRVETLNNFVFSVEQDLPRQLYVSGFRSIFLLENHIVEDGDYINNLNATFQELFFNGSIYGVYQELMKGANFSGIQSSLNQKAGKINANVELINPSLAVSQEDPWHVKFSLQIDFRIADRNNLASWNKTSTLVSYVPIKNFDDPVYLKNGVTNKINKTIYELPIGSNLASHVSNSYYINTTISPSFLDRLEGDLGAQSEYGIESLVDKTDSGMPQYAKSIVDYIYFDPSNNPPTQFILVYKIDDTHANAGYYN